MFFPFRTDFKMGVGTKCSKDGEWALTTCFSFPGDSMFYGTWRHLESFSGGFFCANMFSGMSSQILGEKFGI